MGRKCCVTGCKSNYYPTDKVSVFRLPKYKAERERWMKAIPRDNIPDSTNTVICIKHFPDGFETVSVKGRLRPKNPPSIFSNLPKSLVPTPVPLARTTFRSSSLVRSVESDQLEEYSQKDPEGKRMPREIKPPSRYVTEDGLAPHLARRVATPQRGRGRPSRGISPVTPARPSRVASGRNVNESIVIGDDDDSDVEIVEPPKSVKRKRDEDKDPDWGSAKKVSRALKPQDRSTTRVPPPKTPQPPTSRTGLPARTPQSSGPRSQQVPRTHQQSRTPHYGRSPQQALPSVTAQLQAQRSGLRSAQAAVTPKSSPQARSQGRSPSVAQTAGHQKIPILIDLHMECQDEPLSSAQVQAAKREQLAYEKSQTLIRAAQEGRLLFSPTGETKVLKKPYQPPKAPTPPPAPPPVPVMTPPLLSMALHQPPMIAGGASPNLSVLPPGVTVSMGMPAVYHQIVPNQVVPVEHNGLTPVYGTHGLGVRLPPGQTIPPPPPPKPPKPPKQPPSPAQSSSPKTPTQRKSVSQKGKGSSPNTGGMSKTQAEVLAVLRSQNNKKDSSLKNPSRSTRAEANQQEWRTQKRKSKKKELKEDPRQTGPEDGGRGRNAAERPKRKETKQGQQEGDESGNWVPLGEYYYGKMEGNPTYKETKGDFRFKCWYCNKMLYNNVAAMLHIQGHIDSDKQVNLDLNDLTSCKHCYKNFNTPFEMQTHIEKVHTNKANVLLCRICEKDHDHRYSLREHMRRNHNACEMPYICQLCKFRSSMYSDVVDHFKKKHSNSSSLLCLYCLKTFNVRFISQGWGQTLNYYNHLLKHQIKNYTKKCSQCKLVFHNANTLKIHRQTDHLPNQKGVIGISTKQKASDEVMIKIDGDVTSLGSTGGRISRGGGTLGAGGSAASWSVGTAGVRSLNVPSVKKVLEHRLVLNFGALKISCVECNEAMNKPGHFKKYIQCSMCRFATSCSQAYTNHMLGFHSGQASAVAALNIPADQPMMRKLYCECGFFSLYGNQLANHLVACSKSSCYRDPPPTPAGDNFGTELQDPRKKPDACLLDVLGLVKKDSLALYTSRNMKQESPPIETVEMPDVDEVPRPARRPSLLMDVRKLFKSGHSKDGSDPSKVEKDPDKVSPSEMSGDLAEKLEKSTKDESQLKDMEASERKKEDGVAEEDRKEEKEESKIETQEEDTAGERLKLKSSDAAAIDREKKEEGEFETKDEKTLKEESNEKMETDEQSKTKDEVKDTSVVEVRTPEDVGRSGSVNSRAAEQHDVDKGTSESTQRPALKEISTSEKTGVSKGLLVDYSFGSEADEIEGKIESSGPKVKEGEARDEGSKGEVEESLPDERRRSLVDMEEENTIDMSESIAQQGKEKEGSLGKEKEESREKHEEETDSSASAEQEIEASAQQVVTKEKETVDSNMAEEDSIADTILGEEEATTDNVNNEDDNIDEDSASRGIQGEETSKTNDGDENTDDDSVSTGLKISSNVNGTERVAAHRLVGTSFGGSFSVPGLDSLGEGSSDARDWTGKFPHGGSSSGSAQGERGAGTSSSLSAAFTETVLERKAEEDREEEGETSGQQEGYTDRSLDVDSQDQSFSGGAEGSSEKVVDDSPSPIEGSVDKKVENFDDDSTSLMEKVDKKSDDEREMEAAQEGEEGEGGKSLDLDSQSYSVVEGSKQTTESERDSITQAESSHDVDTQGESISQDIHTEGEPLSHNAGTQRESVLQDVDTQGESLSQDIHTQRLSLSQDMAGNHDGAEQSGAFFPVASIAENRSDVEREREETEVMMSGGAQETSREDSKEEPEMEEAGDSAVQNMDVASSEVEPERNSTGPSWGKAAESFVPASVSTSGSEQRDPRPSTSRSSAYSGGDNHRERSRSRDHRRSRSRDRRSRSRERRSSRSRSRDRQRERDYERRRERERDRHHRDRDRDRHHDRDRDRHRDRRDRSRDRDRDRRDRSRERDRRDRSRDRERDIDRDRERDRERDRDRDRERDRERDRDYYRHKDDRRYR